MKKTILALAVFCFLNVSAQETNYLAKDIAIDTEITVLKNIDFPERMTGVWIQKGKALTTDKMDGLKYLQSNCWLTVDINEYNPETGFTNSILKGTYKLKGVFLEDSKGAVGWIIKSDDGKKFYLQCAKHQSLINGVSDKVGLNISADNIFKIRINSVKRTLKGLMEIKD